MASWPFETESQQLRILQTVKIEWTWKIGNEVNTSRKVTVISVFGIQMFIYVDVTDLLNAISETSEGHSAYSVYLISFLLASECEAASNKQTRKGY